MGLSAGRLRDRVEIRRATKVQNRNGGLETVWSTLATVWAEVIGINGREAVIGQALQGISAFRITIRYREDIGDADQLMHRGRELNVRSISDPDGMREQLLILADTSAVLRDG